MNQRYWRTLTGLFLAFGLLFILAGKANLPLAHARVQASFIINKFTLQGTAKRATGETELPQGATLTMILQITNASADAREKEFGIVVQFVRTDDQKQEFSPLVGPKAASPDLTAPDVTCAIGAPVSSNLTPSEPQQNGFSNEVCSQTFKLAGNQTQIFVVHFDTSQRVDSIKKGDTEGASTFNVRADITDPNDATKSISTGGQRDRFIVVDSQAKLKIQGPIVVTPGIPPQGSLPILTFSIANTGRGAFANSTAALSFSILQSTQPNQLAVDFSLLIAQVQLCDIDTTTNQVRETQCRVLNNRQLVLPAFGEGIIRQLRVVFFTSVLEPGPYQIRGCLRKFSVSTTPSATPTTASSCEPKDPKDDVNQLDIFALNFQVGSPDGVISLAIASESKTIAEIEQGKDATVIFSLANFTGIFQRSVSLSFALDPKAVRKVPLECKESFDQNIEIDLLRGDQCVLDNVSPSRSQDIGVRKFRVLLPTSEYKKEPDKEKVITLTVSDGGKLLRPSAQFKFKLVEKVTTGTDPKQPQGPGPELHPLSLEFIPASPVTQGQIVLIRSKIENSGAKFTGPFTVSFQLFSVNTTSGSVKFVAELGEARKFPGIDPGVIVEASTLLDTCARNSNNVCTLDAGTYLVKVVVSVVPNELDRANNELSTLLTIQKK